uniref:Uncharacterized protein n=1 Tax=Oryzias latipes TaxID=8090 RepID=A0A3P9M7L8_ORYLA
MRPRSKLLSKRRLMLPTITEGNEETVKELNGVNALHNGDQSQAVSSEDYFLSICHLACPTRDVSPNNLHTQQPNAVLRKLRPSQLIRTTLTTFDFNLKEEAQMTLEEQASLMGGNSDPLEYLYGHQNNISMLSGSVRRRFGRQHGGANVAESGSDFPCQHRSRRVPQFQWNHCLSASFHCGHKCAVPVNPVIFITDTMIQHHF